MSTNNYRAIGFLLVLLLPSAGQTQTVKNVLFRQIQEEQIEITYDLRGSGDDRFKIELLASTNGGRSFDITPQTVSGDIGFDVLEGKGKRMIWDVLTDLPILETQTLCFRVVAHLGISPAEKYAGQLVRIRGGMFKMGSSSGESDETPIHTIKISDFQMEVTEVTVRQYRDFCTATGRQMPTAPPWGWTDDHPIVNVSWHDAQTYAQWVGGRLPTEAEWEYAACGGRADYAYPWGNMISLGTGNFADISATDNWNTTAPVAMGKPNALGLYDMAGNVWEWCSDWYSANYYAASSLQLNPQGPETGVRKVIRGGSWDTPPWVARCANRNSSPPDTKSTYIGFRCVR